jgi:hypothetical protein
MRERKGRHHISETEEDGARIVTYRFTGQVNGRGWFAEICLRQDTAESGFSIIFDNQVEEGAENTYTYNVLKDKNNEEYLHAVTFGIYYALANYESDNPIPHCVITVLCIGELAVDTTLDTIAYTAALAVWRLLNIEPINEPYIEGRQIHFPGKKPTIVNADEHR